MTLSDLPPGFVDRLENWGAYFAGGSSRSASSPTAQVCEQLAVAHGQTIRDDYREIHARREIDEVDAQTIEWCWAKSGDRLKGNERALLKAHFVHRSDPRFTCRVLHIRFRSYDATLAQAIRDFERIVAIFETFGHNPLHTNRLPAQNAVP